MSKPPTTSAATRNRLQQTANQATIERGNGELPRRRQDSSEGWAPDATQANIAVHDKMTKVDTDEQRPRAETPPEAYVSPPRPCQLADVLNISGGGLPAQVRCVARPELHRGGC